jgi:hypothetical protein
MASVHADVTGGTRVAVLANGRFPASLEKALLDASWGTDYNKLGMHVYLPRKRAPSRMNTPKRREPFCPKDAGR